MIGALASLMLLGTVPQSDGDRPVVILILSNDTGFVHPLDTAHRTGDLWRGELIAIQSLSEDFTVVRRDIGVEIDCAQSQIRMSASRAYGHQGPLPAEQPDPDPQPSETVDAESWPPLQMLHVIACQSIDLDGESRTLAEAEERIRARINDY